MEEEKKNNKKAGMRRAQRIQLQRVLAHRQFLVVRGPGNGPVDAGELTAVFFVPLPDGGGGVGGRGGHVGSPKTRSTFDSVPMAEWGS